MLGILVDTGKLFQTKPEPSLRENWEVPSNTAPLDADELLQTLQTNARLRAKPVSSASFLLNCSHMDAAG